MSKYKIEKIKGISRTLEAKIRNITINNVWCRNESFEDWDEVYYVYNNGVATDLSVGYKRYFARLTADDYAKEILNFYKNEIQDKGFLNNYNIIGQGEIQNRISKQAKKIGGDVSFCLFLNMNIPTILPMISEDTYSKLEAISEKEIIVNRNSNKNIIKVINSDIERLDIKIDKINKDIIECETNINNFNNYSSNGKILKLNKFISKLLGKKDKETDYNNNIKRLNNKKKDLVFLTQKKQNLENDRKEREAKLRIFEEELENISKRSAKLKQLVEETYKTYQDKQEDKYNQFNYLKDQYEALTEKGIINYLTFLLKDSWYSFEFQRKVQMEFDVNTGILVVNYLLPQKDVIPNEGKNKKEDEWIKLSETKYKKVIENILYSIVIRTLSELFLYDYKKVVNSICFNGISNDRNISTGNYEEKYILSINVTREQIEKLDLNYIEPKECFKYLKGVSATKLYELTEIKPIITPKFDDKRFIENRDIQIENTPNLAEMDWEDFEHLVRQIFEWEFSEQGGEVKVTQSSRDGGVDAIVNDPDPVRGGKIIIQAKRYTNTVGVSAVRDLYGTIINEGANKGILITTSDYGTDSYKFAQGKPITLLNGGHLLYLLEKHGKKAHINIEEAKKKRIN